MATSISKTSDWIEIPDLTTLINASLAGKWVALKDDYSQILASGSSINELMDILSEEEKNANPIFYKVPSPSSYYLPVIR